MATRRSIFQVDRTMTRLAMVCLGVLAWAGAAQAAELTVDMTQAPRPVSPSLYGLYHEDINRAADGVAVCGTDPQLVL
jgi:hypothetical protein